MIEKLTIHNFQAHDKLKIQFDPKITTIIGPSDTGKSAIIRALRWVCTNEPTGEAFIQHGKKGCTVQATVDGQVVAHRRGRNGGANTYHLDDAEYKAFGRGVPEPILNALNIGSISWQGQHDAAYWFSDSAGEVSRQLNAIVNLSVIDATLAGVARQLHKNRTRLEIAEESLATAKQSYADTEWVPAFVEAVDNLEALHEIAEQSSERAASLHTLVDAAQGQASSHGRAQRATELATEMLESGQRAIDLGRDAKAIRELVAAARRYTGDAAQIIPSTKRMGDALERQKEAATKAEALRNLIITVEAQEAKLCQAKKQYEEARAALPKNCPVCGRS